MISGRVDAMAKRAKNPDDTLGGRDPLLVAVGTRILAARRLLKLSQAELGLKAGVTGHTVFQAENGLQNITLKTLAGLASALGVEVKSLLPDDDTGVGSPPAEIASALATELGRAVMLTKRIEALLEAFKGNPVAEPSST